MIVEGVLLSRVILTSIVVKNEMNSNIFMKAIKLSILLFSFLSSPEDCSSKDITSVTEGNIISTGIHKT